MIYVFEEQSNRGGNALIHLDKKRKSFNSQISNAYFCFDYFRRIKERGGGEDGGRRRRGGGGGRIVGGGGEMNIFAL